MLAFLKIILRSFLFRKKRTFLTVLGITIGTTLILTLVLLGDGLEKALTSQLQAFGGDLIYVMPGKEDNPLAGLLSGGEIREREFRILKSVDGVQIALPMDVKNFRVEYQGEEKVLSLHGSPIVDTEKIFGASQGFSIREGAWPKSENANQFVLGSLVAKERFSNPIRLGDELVIKGKRFRVSGILNPIGNADDDSRIYMSLDRFRSLTGKRAGVGFATIQVEAGRNPKEVADNIREALDRQRGVGDLVVFSSENASRIIRDVLGVVQLILAVFAAVALVVGGVGIMNTMFTSVLERTREIGVMKALGSTNRNILTLFLMEAGFLGLVGGSFGIALSYAFALLIEFAAMRKDLSVLQIDFDPVAVLTTLLFTFVLGMIFGVIPAWRGSRFAPTEALRYE